MTEPVVPGGEPTGPDRSADDLDIGWGESPATFENDDRLLDDRPPHHENRDHNA